MSKIAVIGMGVLLTALHLSVLMGYATGRLPHKPFTPFDAVKLMFCCSLIFSIAGPAFWFFGLRASKGWIVLILTLIGFINGVLDIWFYWMASAAV